MPETRRLLLLRHGRTAWNLEQRAQGHTDVPLDETGRRQAEAVAPTLAELDPVFVRSSDLSRACTTAEVVAAAAGLEVCTDPRLREFDLGERTGMTMPEYAEAHADEYAMFRAGRYDVVPGGESVGQLLGRFVPALDEAMAALAPGQLGIVVAHGAALKVAVLGWLGWDAGAAGSLHGLHNCHWGLVDDSGQPDGPSRGLRLAAWNRHA